MKPAEARAARKAREQAAGFNADERAEAREKAPIVIGGVTFTRRRKDWKISRAMRQAMRAQEKALAKANRTRQRVAELEVRQVELAAEPLDLDGVAEGDLDERTAELEAAREAKIDELEGKIDALVNSADDDVERAELTTYRLLALLLIPPADGYGEDNTPLVGFGPDELDDEDAVEQAIEFLQPALDVEDAAALANELTGSREPDPQPTPSSETGST